MIAPGCFWLDVGGGHHIFPENADLSRTLAARSAMVVAVDPSENVRRNPYVHERVQSMLEGYQTERTFDVATLRMVAEHVAEPDADGGGAASIDATVRSCGDFYGLQVAPLTLVSRALPFRWHHPIKKLFWGGEEEDTFPVEYKMNSRAAAPTTVRNEWFSGSLVFVSRRPVDPWSISDRQLS